MFRYKMKMSAKQRHIALITLR